MSLLFDQDPQLAEVIRNETERQRQNINLIASENYSSRAVLEAQGSVLTNKYAEGYPGRRYYGGCEFVDVAETLAIQRAEQLFGAAHANVQPHSGAQANMAAYFSVIEPGDTVMGLSLDHGGHLTHGSPVNFSSKLYKFVSYGVDRELELIDYDEMERLAREHRPKLIVTGATAYTRTIDFSRFRFGYQPILSSISLISSTFEGTSISRPGIYFTIGMTSKTVSTIFINSFKDVPFPLPTLNILALDVVE